MVNNKDTDEIIKIKLKEAEGKLDILELIFSSTERKKRKVLNIKLNNNSKHKMR